MRRYRNFGMGLPKGGTAAASSTSSNSTVTKFTPPTATVVAVKTNPVMVATAKVIRTNNNISDVEKQRQLKNVIKNPPKAIVPRPPSFRPAPSPPVVNPPKEDPVQREKREKEEYLRQWEEEERIRKEEETRRKEEERRRQEEEADRQQQPPSKPTPTPSPSPTPSPPVAVRPSPPRTSIRMPTAIPRTYSVNRRVSFRAPRLMLPKPTMRKLQPRPTKQRWNAQNPTYPSFMNRVTPGQYSFQSRGSISSRNKHSHPEIAQLKRQLNTINTDALRTKTDYAVERQGLQMKLRDYQMSPVTQLRDHAKGVFSIVDDASKFATPSVNGMGAFPQVGEGTSKALAVGVALLAGLFIIGRVE